MKHKADRGISACISFFEYGDHQVRIGFIRYVPCNDFPRIEINDHAKIIPPPGGLEVGDITDPYQIRCFLYELLIQLITAIFLVLIFGVKGCAGGDFGQHHRLHEPVHSADADINAIITFKNTGNFICTKPFLALGIYLQNEGFQLLIFRNSWCRGCVKVLIIGASVDPKYPAKGFDRVLKS